MAHTVIRLKEVASTNSYIRQYSEDGLVVVAEHQTAGRGRRGRTFQSVEGKGLYLSVLLNKPGLTIEQVFSLTPIAAQAVADAVEGISGVRPGIKWINDLILNEGKLCGILTELVLTERGKVSSVILGIGINLNQCREDFDAELRDKAISLAMATGRNWDREQMLEALLDALDRRLEEWLAGRLDLEGYRKDCITLGRDVVVLRGKERREARAEAVDDSFGLVVCYPDGRREVLSSGEVSVRGKNGYI